MIKNWTKKELEFLKDNYPEKGKLYCSENLNKTEPQIRYAATKLKLKFNLSSEFHKEWQSRAAESKKGKARPQHSAYMKDLHKKGELKPFINSQTPTSISNRMKDWHDQNDHPKGMKGKKHSTDTVKIISRNSKAMWQDENSIVNQPAHRQKLSDRASKSMNIRQKSPSGNIYSRGKKGKISIGGKTFYARSSWEANIAAYYQFLKDNGDIKDWEHEPKTFWFLEIKRGVRSYLPDFLITENNGKQKYVEVKGYMDAKSKTKIKRFAKYYPEYELILIQSKEYNAIKKNSGLIKNWGLL
jgi:hypothetical protein